MTVISLAGSQGCVSAAPEAAAPTAARQRVVCLGDSITDGNTYPQIIMQALREAGKPVPVCICAGVASDTAAQMLARLERDVLVFKPNLVTFSAGTNDSLRGVAPEAYEQSLRAIAEKLKALGIPMILQTPCAISPAPGGKPEEMKARTEKAAAAEAVGDKYAEVLRKVAAEYGYKVAETQKLQRQARADGKEIMSPDGIHPNYLGQALMARAILDAMGYADVPLPKQFKVALFPGVIHEWKMRLAPDGKAVDEKTVLEVNPDATWKTYALPDAEPQDASPEKWDEQIRQNGFALQIEKKIGKGLVQAVAVIATDRARKVYINTGIGVSTVWFNGVRIHNQGPGWTGFHAGKERIPVELKPGKNTLLVELSGQHFFLSVTDRLIWEE